jgi:hypothetical protein
MNGESVVLLEVASRLLPVSHRASAVIRPAITATLRWQRGRKDDLEDQTHDVLVKALARAIGRPRSPSG